MSKPSKLLLARREAAASIDWPERTPLLLNPDPAVRRRLKRACVILGAFAVLWAMCADSQGPLRGWLESIQNREMRPTMESAMKAGNRTAGTWLATHYWKDYPGLLQAEAEAGEPNAMLLMGRVLMLNEHPERQFKLDPSLTGQQIQALGVQLVQKAAAAGNEKALLFALQHGGL